MKRHRKDRNQTDHVPEPVDRPGFRASEPQANIAHPGVLGHQDQPGSGDPAPATARDSAPSRKHARKRGGQPGNKNALTHGFYSTIFKENERRLLAEVPLTDLSAEIELIRVTSRRFLEALAASRGELDFETQLTALRAVNLSAHSIATLLRAHALTSLHDRALADFDSPSPDDEPETKQ